MNPTAGRRVAIVAGVRTPFCKAGTALREVPAVDLVRHVAVELLERTGLDGGTVDLVVVGQVVQSVLATNVAREVSLLPQFPKSVPAYSVTEACASANQAITDAADQIRLGHAEVAIAGGTESLSNIPILHSRRMADTLVAVGRAKTLGDRARLLARVRPRDLVPVVPAIAEPSTGLTMGESAEKMAKENAVARDAQDVWALRSHHLAYAGMVDGRLPAEIVPYPTARGAVSVDNGVRADASLERLQQLRPVFDRAHGTVTAGNASPLTDGAAIVLLMSEEAARALGYAPLAFLRSYAVSAVDPGGQLLMGPVHAVPLALRRAGLSWSDIGLIEMHEAFASQVLSNLQWFEQRERWSVNPDIINVMGGSIAIGHPFGATGARLVTTLANEMRRRQVAFGLVSVCAQGGLGSAIVLESAES